MIKIKNVWNKYKNLDNKNLSAYNHAANEKQPSSENEKNISITYHRNYGTFTENHTKYTEASEMKKETCNQPNSL